MVGSGGRGVHRCSRVPEERTELGKPVHFNIFYCLGFLSFWEPEVAVVLGPKSK